MTEQDKMYQMGMTPSNEMGDVKPLFKPSEYANAQNVFGTRDQRAMSMPQRGLGVDQPLLMKDQTGDGKITRADVIKARIEGYKE